MEKADILEQTVDYIYSLSRQQETQKAQGFVSCLHEVGTFLQAESPPGCRALLRIQLLTQLSRRARQLVDEQPRSSAVGSELFKSMRLSRTITAEDNQSVDDKLLTDESRRTHLLDQHRIDRLRDAPHVDMTYHRQHRKHPYETDFHHHHNELRGINRPTQVSTDLYENVRGIQEEYLGGVAQNSGQRFNRTAAGNVPRLTTVQKYRVGVSLTTLTDSAITMNELQGIGDRLGNGLGNGLGDENTMSEYKLKACKPRFRKACNSKTGSELLFRAESNDFGPRFRQPLAEIQDVDNCLNMRRNDELFCTSPMWRPW